ncbi:MAG: binary toxin-like calcium binding domain-containing protein [Planctomycetota bacterium]
MEACIGEDFHGMQVSMEVLVMSKSRLIVVCMAATLFAAGCGGGGGGTLVPVDPNPSGLPTLGEIEQLIHASQDKDTDGDYIPDDVEVNTLGTNPKDRDTDRDGLPDNYEIFGEGIYDYDDYVPDEDKDALIAARDHDDNNDKINDGRLIDTDGDNIPNYLEYYGYAYDWLTGRFVSCEDVDCTGLTVYKTDPLQKSTDQDPYPDDVEVSGLNMDVSVSEPGIHPLVPACPSLVVELAAFSVTLNENITYGRGGSLSQGTTWTREATRTHSQTTEHSWEVGVTVGVGFDGPIPSGSVEVTTTYGGKWASTNETSNSVSHGESIVNEANWSEARSFNPTEAAHVKLQLKAHNRGASCMSNVLPTLTLRVAGLNVATFQPGNAAIQMLPPGGSYPMDDGTYWVVDSTADGEPITLTMNELRAFESGAPITVVVTQVKADVMRLGSDDAWETVGDATEFATRCDAACADICLDMGDGSSLHERVYCGSGPSEPVVTLGDALAWCANGYEDDEGLWVSYIDKNGVPQTTNLKDWKFVFDRETMVLNGMDPDDLAGTVPADFRLSAMVLHPDSRVFGKAPRDAQVPAPLIHFAYFSYDERRARVCTTDYQGVDEVFMTVIVDPNDGSTPVQYDWPMDKYTAESNLYTRSFSESEWSVLEEVLDRWMDPASGSKDVIKTVVRSINGEASERPFGLVPPNPQAVAPIIDFVRMDVTEGTIYARVRPDDNYPPNWHETYPVVWVKAFHPAFVDTGGVIELGEPVNSYEDKYGWIAKLPLPWYAQTPIKVVAYVAPGVYTERWVTPKDITSAFAIGNARFFLQHFWFWDIDPDGWSWQWIDLDRENAAPGGIARINPLATGTVWWHPSWGIAYGHQWQDWWEPTAAMGDVWARWDDVSGQRAWKLYFNVPWTQVDTTVYSYDDLKPAIAESLIPADIDPAGSNLAKDSVYVFRTSQGRIAKLEVTYANAWNYDKWYLFFGADFGRECLFDFRYVVFDTTSAQIFAESTVIYDKDTYGIKLDGSGSKGTTWRWEVKSGPAGYSLEDDDLQIATLFPASKTVGGYEQTYVVELVIDSGQNANERDEVTIKVFYPTAKIEPGSQTVEFEPTDVRRIAMSGGESIGARDYSWVITKVPTGSTKAAIESPNSANAVFLPDEEGLYRIELTINKGKTDEHKTFVEYTVQFN